MKSLLVSHRTGVRLALGSALVAMALASAVVLAPPARADIDVHIDIGGAPPPPSFTFRARPHWVRDPDTRVYIVDDPGVGDNDVFFYNGYYWAFNNGYWYRSRTWRRGFVVVRPRYVPSVIYRVPPTHWKHRASGPPGLMNKPGHMPPGQAKKMGRGMDNGQGNDQGNGKGRGGHGK